MSLSKSVRAGRAAGLVALGTAAAVAWGAGPGAPAPIPPSEPPSTPARAAPPAEPSTAQPRVQPRKDPEGEREVVLVLAGGQQLRGVLVTQDALEVVLRIASVNTRIPRDQVERVIPQPTVRERYADMREVIDDHDVDRLLLLVEWLRTNKLYEEALRELDHVIAIEPRNGDALRLEKLVRQQIEMRSRADAGGGKDSAAKEEPEARRIRRPTPGEFPLLTDEQINLIKVYELSLADPPRVLIERDAVRAFLDAYSGAGTLPSTRDGRAAFERRPSIDVLRAMFELRAREFYGRVRVQGVPESMRKFRDNVQSAWLVNSCATTRCHGGEEAGRLLLFNRAAASEPATFTNFMILDQFRLPNGEPLIDYSAPERSALLQMGLPRHDALLAHPAAHGWAPVFRSRDDRRYQQAVEWIKSMHQPRPDYGITYEPPKAAGRRFDPPGAPAPAGPAGPEGPRQPDR